MVLASRNSARFLENGKIVEIEGKNLFLNPKVEEIEGLGKFEVYPNRDSVPYKEMYGLKDALTVIRGTYRNLGWCETLKKIVDLGWSTKRRGPTQGHHLQANDGRPGRRPGRPARQRKPRPPSSASPPHSEIIKRLEWLGLFSDEIAPDGGNYLDILSKRLQEKLFFKEGEKDLLVLRHRFMVENKDKSQGPDHLHADRLRHPLRRQLHGPHRQPAHGHRHPPDRRGQDHHQGRADPGPSRDLRAGAARTGDAEHQDGGKEDPPEIGGHWTRKPSAMNGEQAAAAFLKNKGFQIIQPNYRVAGAEVDLVASTGDILCFVEVKTRKSSDFGSPEAFVTRPKQLKIIRAAKFFSARKPYREFPRALRRRLGHAPRRRLGLRPSGKRLRGVTDA